MLATTRPTSEEALTPANDHSEDKRERNKYEF